MKKFYIIIIDSGWPSVGHKVIQDSKKVINGYLSQGQDIIEFSEKESQDFMRNFPQEIGKDPIMIITHLDPQKASQEKQKQIIKELDGIRIDFGNIDNDKEVLRYLFEICRLIKDEKFISDISWEERRRMFGSAVVNISKDLLSKILEVIL